MGTSLDSGNSKDENKEVSKINISERINLYMALFSLTEMDEKVYVTKPMIMLVESLQI